MRAVAWHGKRDVRVDTVPDPAIEEPTDAIVRITSTGICGSDLHLYEVKVIPFNISCGQCFMCIQGLQSQCETTQVREHGMGASLLGYTKLYGQVPGGQAAPAHRADTRRAGGR